MIKKLFANRRPAGTDLILDPGCGDGPFIAGIIRYCKRNKLKIPRLVGVELDPSRAATARAVFAKKTVPTVRILEKDYLDGPMGPADFIIGNPPYVGITGLDEDEKKRYRASFSTAVRRFDLYLLFFERSLANLKPGGRLVFITPEKFEYVHTAEPLRRALANVTIEELDHVAEDTFPGLMTSPTITTVTKRSPPTNHETLVKFRDGTIRSVNLPATGESWSRALGGPFEAPPGGGFTLKDISVRVSCGIATGTDGVFVLRDAGLPRGLRQFAYPTISGRQLGAGEQIDGHDIGMTKDVMLVPYGPRGKLLPPESLGDLRTYLRRPDNYRKLASRTHVAAGARPYYQFHDNAPLPDILRPKLLCKDIAHEPKFWLDREGLIVPRHSVYYVVPRDGVSLEKLAAYLNGDDARAWIKAHAQRASNGFYRLQSTVLKRLPIPQELVPKVVRGAPVRSSNKAVQLSNKKRPEQVLLN